MTADIESARYRLRLAEPGDEGHYVALYTDPRVMHAIGPPLDVQCVRAAFDRVCRHNRAKSPGHRLWVITGRHDAEAVGITALRRAANRAELGIMLRPEAWNRGVAREVFGPLLRHAFAAMDLHIVDAERRDDAHGELIDRLLRPFGFVDAPPSAPGLRRWMLSRPPVRPVFGVEGGPG